MNWNWSASLKTVLSMVGKSLVGVAEEMAPKYLIMAGSEPQCHLSGSRPLSSNSRKGRGRIFARHERRGHFGSREELEGQG